MLKSEAAGQMYTRCSKHCKGQEPIPGSINYQLKQPPVLFPPFGKALPNLGGISGQLHLGGLHESRILLALSQIKIQLHPANPTRLL